MIRRISITVWGNKSKEDWINWYNDIKELSVDMGYSISHLGIISETYDTGKVVTVKRKEKSILSLFLNGEIPSSLSCYSLPDGFKIAAFDYDFLAVRNCDFISIILKEFDYNEINEKRIIDVIDKYIIPQNGEVYSTDSTEVPLIYATQKCNEGLESYRFIKNLNETL